MVLYYKHFKRTVLLITSFIYVVCVSYAQSPYSEREEFWLPQKDSSNIPNYSTFTDAPLFLPNMSMPKRPIRLESVKMPDIHDVSKFDNTWKLPVFKHSVITASFEESSYKNLMDRRTVIFASGYKWNNLQVGIRFIATQYETTYSTNQFGVSGFMEYDFSPNWSMYIWGTLYNNTPYFSMAAFPLVETSSYGGWIKYEGKNGGIKLGARRFYDTFQRKWKTEPIVTPTINLGKKVILELPVGPFVQKSIERALRKRPNKGPIIMPDFQQ